MYFVANIKRKQSHREATETQGRLNAIFNNSPAEIYLKDELGRYLMVNPAFENLFKVKNDDILGLLPTDIHEEELALKTIAHDQQILRDKKTVARYEIAPTEHGLKTLHTIKFPTFNNCGELTGIGAIVSDITDQRAIESELRQFQKMKAIGLLTGGIAHDFNNLLAVIMGNLELIELSQDEAAVKICINEAIAASERGAKLTNSLLSFARKSHLSPEPTDLARLVRETQKWAMRVIPNNIVFSVSAPPALSLVSVDKSMTQNAILNILLNAKDSLPDGGNIMIKISNVTLKKGTRLSEGEVQYENGFVCLEISDDGEGIPPEILNEICTPFFTTKPVGGGSGLGLSMVHGFMTQSEGYLDIQSEVAKGTSIRLYFKTIAETDAIDPRTRRASFSHIPKGISILIAEDDPSIRSWLSRYFETQGINATITQSGDAAFSEFLEAPDAFDLLISDIVMPGKLQGPSLVSAVRLEKPNLPVIFLSGYPRKSHNSEMDQLGGDTYLMKPVSSAELTDAIKLCLALAQKNNAYVTN